MALYGNDIDDTVTPLEANLPWLVKMKKGEFVGRARTARAKRRRGSAEARGLHGRRTGVPSTGRCSLTGWACSRPRAEWHGEPDARHRHLYVLSADRSRGPGHRARDRRAGKPAAATVVKMPFYTKGTHK